MSPSTFEGVLRVVRLLGTTADPGEILGLIATTVVDVLGFSNASIAQVQGDELVVSAADGRYPPGEARRVGDRSTVSEWAAVLEGSERVGGLHRVSTGVRPASVTLLAPLREGEQLLGMLRADGPSEEIATDGERLAIVESLAAHAAVAIGDGRRREASAAQHHELETRWRSTLKQTQLGGALEATLARRATARQLRSLPDRSAVEGFLESCLARDEHTGVLFIDVDHFKTINDGLGFEIGDQMLCAMAERLAGLMDQSMLLGRPGSDQFVIVIPDAAPARGLARYAETLVASCSEPLLLPDRELTVTLSIGIAVAGDSWDPEQLLGAAEGAMLVAKRGGGARFEFYDPSTDASATTAELELEQDLRRALARPAHSPEHDEELLPYFQPIVRLHDGAVVGYEALARWHHPTRGVLMPDEFVPIAERSGVVVPLGWQMLASSCRAMRRLSESRPPKEAPGLFVSVNVSANQIGRGQLLGAVSAALASTGLLPNQLHLEITETAMVEASPRAISEIAAIADLGVAIALDDFGVGYSSLSMLKDLVVHIVKIDKSFITPLVEERSAGAIVRRVVSLCNELGIEAIAEGVQDTAQLNVLRALGCTYAQGFLFGAPTLPTELGSVGNVPGMRSTVGYGSTRQP